MFAVLLFSAFACLFLALMLTGAGHGWTSAVPVSVAGLIAAPVSGVAWAMRRRAMGKGIALLLVVGSIIANGILLALTASEGTEYFDRVWSSIPEGVIAWAALWAVWQVVALVSLLWRAQAVE